MTRGRRLAVTFAVALVVLVLVANACGVPEDDEPRALAADRVPFGLLDEAPSARSTTTTAPEVQRVNTAVYFLVGERLQPSPRAVPDPGTPTRALSALLDGPTDEEAVNGLRTAIHPATEVVVTRPSPDVVAVDLNAAFAAVPTQEQRLALGQIVFTATGVPGVRAVLFTLAGAPVGVPRADGTVTSEPVRRDDFPSIAPLQPQGSTTPA